MEAWHPLEKDIEGLLPLPTFHLIMKLWPSKFLGHGISRLPTCKPHKHPILINHILSIPLPLAEFFSVLRHKELWYWSSLELPWNDTKWFQDDLRCRGPAARQLPGRQACVVWFPGMTDLEKINWASLVAQLVKNPPAMWENWVWSLGWEDPLEKGKATHSSFLAWRIPWTVQSMGLQRVGHGWATFTFCGKPQLKPLLTASAPCCVCYRQSSASLPSGRASLSKLISTLWKACATADTRLRGINNGPRF